LKTNLFLIVLFVLFTVNCYSQDPEEGKKQKQETETIPPTEALVEAIGEDDLNAEQIIEQNKPALVSIWFHSDNFYSYYYYEEEDTVILNGSGFIFSEEGIIGTNYHVIDGFDSILVKTSDEIFHNAELLLVDEENDIAIIRILDTLQQKYPFVKLGNSDDAKVGQIIYAVGSPLGFEYTISEGIIAAIREEEKVDFNDPYTYELITRTFDKVLQITAAISPGNSGGALFNSKGEVIGVTSYSYGFYGNLNFAIAINSFKELVSSVNFAELENNEEFVKKKEENLFHTNFRLANNYKNRLYNTWYYSRQVDTMTVLDTFALKQDSINQINLVKAERYYNKCLELKPDSFYIYQDMMDLYVFIEDFKKAEDLYKTIRERFDSDSLLNTLSSSLAMAYSTSKDYKKALMFYEKMLKLDTTDIFIHFQIANTYELMKKYKKAIKGYEDVIRRDSSYTQAYIQLGKIYYEKYEDYDEADRYLTTALERDILNYGYSSYNLDLHYYLGMIAVEDGRKFDAILSYMDMKSIYTYSDEDNKKKLKLYKAIREMD
jgi:S1-C subfamily serine protease/cytochrome c-type biogenesis protein CcmH/NrfG